MDCASGYKTDNTQQITEHFTKLLSYLDDSEFDDNNIIDQPYELVQIIQETINKMIIELSIMMSSMKQSLPNISEKKRFLLDKFFTLFRYIIQRNASILEQIQNINVNYIGKLGSNLIKSPDFSFLSDFLLTNLFLHATKYYNCDNEPVLSLLVCIQEVDPEYFTCLFHFQSNLLTRNLYHLLKAQYLSDDFIISNDSVLSLIILAENTNFFINDNQILCKFNKLLPDLISHNSNIFEYNNKDIIRKYEEILLLHAELNHQKLFFKNSSEIDPKLIKLRLDTLSFFMDLALEVKDLLFDKVSLTFILKSMKSDTNFDFNSFFNICEATESYFFQLFSKFIEKPDENHEGAFTDEPNEIFIEINTETRNNLFDLISTISSSVDSLPDSICDLFLDFICNQFYHGALSEDDSQSKECSILTFANLTSITGTVTDKIVSYDGLLEDIIEMIDESSFETKIYICIIFSNLLFECSQYFNSLLERINIIEKLKPLIWSSNPSLHREVCTIFLNIFGSIEDEELGYSIREELKEEGIIESLSMMLSETNSNAFDDKSYIFELSEVLNNYQIQ